MELLNIFAMVGMVINDLLALLSVVGSTILLFGAFSKAPLKRYGKIAEWSFLGLIFGGLFQISMAITGTTPEKIGVVFRMSSLMVSALLGVSLLMLIGRWAIKKLLHQNI
jgi:uncharacterized membrane protein